MAHKVLNAGAYIRDLLLGADPNGALPEQFGTFSGVVKALKEAHSAGGTGAVREVYEAFLATAPDLAKLVEAEGGTSKVDQCPPLPEEATACYSAWQGERSWIDDYADWAEQASPTTPRSFHEAGALWAASVAIARRLVIRMSAARIYPNLYLLFVAPSTLYGKTTSFKLLDEMFSKAGMRHYLLPGRMTPEAMVQELSTAVPTGLLGAETEIVNEWLRERAFAAQRGWLIDEAAGLLDAMKRDYNAGLITMMLNLYECHDHMTEQTISRWRVAVNKAYLSFFGATTPAAMLEHFGNSVLWENGLWPRFAIITPNTPPIKAFYPDPLDMPMSLPNGLRNLAGLFVEPTATLEDEEGKKTKRVVIEDEMAASTVLLDPETIQAWRIYSNATRHDFLVTGQVDEPLWGMYGRLGTHAIKVATILAALDTDELPVRVTLRHWARAQQMVESWRESVHRLRGREMASKEEALTHRVLTWLTDAGDTGLSTRTIYQRLHASREEGRALMEEITKQGHTERFEIVGSNGKKVEMWRIT